MAKSELASGSRRVVTADRSSRLAHLLRLLGQQPHTRERLLSELGLDVRGFYRDLQLLRDLKVQVELDEGRYVLTEPLEEALARLPFPDPGLTLTEIMLLAEGSTPAHRRLRRLIEEFTGRKYRAPSKPTRKK